MNRAGNDSRREKLAAIGEAVTVFAHEIRNPLAGISGALQVMAEDLPVDSPAREIFREILDEIESLDAAVKDLLAYARTPAPQLILTDINAMLERTSVAEGPAARSSGVEIKTAFGALPDTMIDREQMGKVFVSMVRNAVERMPGGGILTVTTQYRADRGEIEIAFSDTGKGIPGEKIRDVFQPFFSTKQLDTGLKLAISRNVAEGHKGRMEVLNNAGAGCTFSIVLPHRG